MAIRLQYEVSKCLRERLRQGYNDLLSWESEAEQSFQPEAIRLYMTLHLNLCGRMTRWSLTLVGRFPIRLFPAGCRAALRLSSRLFI